jgi:hypothetical protein
MLGDRTRLGRMEEARAAAAAGLAIDPTFNLPSFRAAQISDDPYYLAWRERVGEGCARRACPKADRVLGAIQPLLSAAAAPPL